MYSIHFLKNGGIHTARAIFRTPCGPVAYRTFENNVQGDFYVAYYSINSCPIF